jgi:hypothetical protein
MKNDYTFLELEAGHWLIQSNYSEVWNAIRALRFPVIALSLIIN